MKAEICVTVALAGLLGACANSKVIQENRLSVTQIGQLSGAEYVTCRDQDCAPPTTKYVMIPAAPKPRPRPVASAPEPIRLKVHFRFGKYTLDKEGKAELAKAIDAIHKLAPKNILVLGRTDPVGKLPYNKKLALRRANTVRDAILRSGATSETVVAMSHDPCCNGDVNAGERAHYELRRADVEIAIHTGKL